MIKHVSGLFYILGMTTDLHIFISVKFPDVSRLSITIQDQFIYLNCIYQSLNCNLVKHSISTDVYPPHCVHIFMSIRACFDEQTLHIN